MSEYTFEIEYSDGYIEEYHTCAVNKIMAYEMLTEYLGDFDIDPRTVTVNMIDVVHFSEEENN